MTKHTFQFSKDFILMMIGQIISLFGNQILRFTLPLYLLNQTGSSCFIWNNFSDFISPNDFVISNWWYSCRSCE